MSPDADFDLIKELPCADICIGPKQHMRIYGFDADDMGAPLVEVRIFRDGVDDPLRLTVAQAESISTGLLAAARKAANVA